MENVAELIASPAAWAALVTLIVMEVVLGIDNLIFISILSNKLPEEQRVKARRWGIGLALIMRLALLTMIAYTGRYRLKDGVVRTQVEAAWNESWVGGEQVRHIAFETDDILHIRSPEMPHPNLLDRKVHVVVTWVREE